MASFNYTTSGKTVTFTAVGEFWHVYWTFGDGSQGVGTSTSHTYADYKKYDVLVDYREKGDTTDRATTLSFTLTDPSKVPNELNGNIIEDAFNAKPIIIPGECTGNIQLIAEIKKLSEKNDAVSDTKEQSTSISATVTIVADDLTTGILS